MQQEVEHSSWVAAQVASAKGALGNGAAEQLFPLRSEALESFTALGFPLPGNEEWKYTNVSAIAKGDFALAAAADRRLPSAAALEKQMVLDIHAPRLVFVDGIFTPELSSLDALPSGLTVTSFASVLAAGPKDPAFEMVRSHVGRYASNGTQAFVALNTALVRDGALVAVSRGTAVQSPVLILFVASGTVDGSIAHSRVLVLAEESAEVSLVEQYLGLGDARYFTTAVTEIVAAENAVVDHYRVQQDGPNAFHVSTVEIRQERASTCSTSSFTFGGGLVRNDVNPTLLGEGCTTHMYGLNVIGDRQHVDNHTVLDHAKPHCESNEWYKGIYGGKSKGVFNGTIIVRPHAQKTNAIQSNQSLLLSKDAETNAKPQLKIWADDVKCTHGATVGQLDEDAMFYMRSRGISEGKAKDILIHAFADDIIGKVKPVTLREQLTVLLDEKLQTLLPAKP